MHAIQLESDCIGAHVEQHPPAREASEFGSDRVRYVSVDKVVGGTRHRLVAHPRRVVVHLQQYMCVVNRCAMHVQLMSEFAMSSQYVEKPEEGY